MSQEGHDLPPGQVVPSDPNEARRRSGEYPGETFEHKGIIPPGLELLEPMNHLFIQQQIEILEVVCGCETNNRYSVKNGRGQDLYRVTEDTGCCARICCGKHRAFKVIIDDFNGHEIQLERNLAVDSCWCPCCLNHVKVYSPPTNLIGMVVQEWSLWKGKFVILNAAGQGVLRIKGPCCTSSCCNDVEFKIFSIDGSAEVGRISKKWGGIIKEAFTDADNFGVSFPEDLDVQVKATLLGAAILIDFMYFERSGNKSS